MLALRIKRQKRMREVKAKRSKETLSEHLENASSSERLEDTSSSV